MAIGVIPSCSAADSFMNEANRSPTFWASLPGALSDLLEEASMIAFRSLSDLSAKAMNDP